MKSISFLMAVVVLAGCSPFSPEEEVPDQPYTGPGTEEWGEIDITCDATSDCLTGEICSDGFCQVDRCGGDLLPTEPPLGSNYYFQREDELALLDTESTAGIFYLDAFDPSNLSYDGSYKVGSQPALDVAGGALLGARPQALYALAFGGSKQVELAGTNDSLTLPFAPMALATGDTDLDGLDELIGVSSNGRVAICSVDTEECDEYSMSGTVEVIDIAAADVDADAIAEVLLLLDADSTRYIMVFNIDHEVTGQPASWSTSVSDDVFRISGGDLDNDRYAEVVVLRDGGYWDYWDDKLEVYVPDLGSDALRQLVTHETEDYGEGRDLEVADKDGDGDAEIYLLNTEARVVTFQLTGSALREEGATQYSPSVEPDRIATADHNGDAPIAELSGNIEACQGNPVPVMLMVLPPYDETFANGTSRVGFGSFSSSSESTTETVSLGLSVDVGYKAGFTEFFSGKVSSTVSWRIAASTTNTTRLSVGTSYTLIADPGLYGPNYGGVVLSWGCFDGYSYTVDDPSNHLGGVHGEDIVFSVPSGGGSSIWSTPRYNAMAELSDSLPILDVPYDVGKVDSYPTSPEKIDGSRLKNSDMLFTDPPMVIASDVSRISWSTRVSEQQTNSSNTDINLAANSGVTVGGVSVGLGVSGGFGKGYSLMVGEEANFNGTLPPLPDNSATPEDEYAAHAYGIRPYVYRQAYETADGGEAAFYVQTYTVEQ
ncbi:MAG: VCBS repeat-containing protein [Myxococcota bacterium]|nr:VCBS repeat-containing protein [Myxococcota bacterium]